jgi:hypothetical protein
MSTSKDASLPQSSAGVPIGTCSPICGLCSRRSVERGCTKTCYGMKLRIEQESRRKVRMQLIIRCIEQRTSVESSLVSAINGKRYLKLQ